MRRMMFRLAQAAARKYGCLAIATGESVGQVASQTLESIACINDAVTIPVLRPLICYDKLDIIALAEKIGTYETSILPYEDCCTIFDPKNPVTKPTVEKAEYYESRFDYQKMIDEAMEQEEVRTVYPKTAEEDFL
jgi:thiamine biosynthesis protein ThiI